MKTSSRHGVGSRPVESSHGVGAADFRQLWLALQAHHLELEAQNEQLRQSLEQLEHERDGQVDFYNAAPVGCVATDRNGIITSANLQMASLVGRSSGSLRNRTMAELFTAEDQDVYHRHHRLLIEGGEAVVSELRLRREGDPVWVSLESVPIGSDGRIHKVWCFLRDISGRKKAEHEHVRVVERARQIEKLDALGALAGRIAGELKDILPVLVDAQSAPGLAVGDPVAHLSDDVVAAAARASRLTQRLLDFAQRRPPHREIFRADTIAERAFTALERLAPERIRVRLMQDGVAGWTEGDSDHCLQILMHVCSNAVEAIPGQGAVTLVVRNVLPGDPRLAEMPELPPRPYVAVEVVDDGIGMDAASLRHACEPFFTTKGGGQTCGLGLAAVVGTVRAWGGGLAIASQPGHGTRVTMLFPAHATSPLEDGTPSVQEPAPRSPATILVIDGDASVRDGLTQRLETMGHRVLTASTCEAAVALYRQGASSIGTVLVYLSAPFMDGVACFAQLKQIDPNVRVVLFVGRAEGYEAAAAQALLAQGCCRVVGKPCTPEGLSNALAEALRD